MRDRKVLLIDDVTNTGATVCLAVRHLKEEGCAAVITAAVAWDRFRGHKPEVNFAARYTDNWVVFPWERTIPNSIR